MAMTKCKECGTQISTKAESCPHCGAKRKKTSLLTWLFLIFFVIPVLISVFIGAGSSPTPTAKKPKTPEEIRTERIESGFSAWDGSHRALERWIKKNLKDPDSYEHIETRYGDKGDHLIVNTKYRARNSFGGMTIEQVSATANLDGSLIEVTRTP